MPKVSREHLEARRAQILDGARRAFAKHGYERATVAVLERETGLSRGAIFNYFPDKWSLFFELAVQDQIRWNHLIAEGGIDAVVDAIAHESPDWLGVYVDLARHVRTRPELEAQLEERLKQEEIPPARRYFEQLQERGELRDDVTTKEIGEFLNVVLNGIAFNVAAGNEVDLPVVLKLVHDAIGRK